MSHMTSEQMMKRLFVTKELGDAIYSATDGFVFQLEYRVEGAEEFVIVTTDDGDGLYDSFQVNVTADSRWAILKDVTRAVAARYE